MRRRLRQGKSYDMQSWGVDVTNSRRNTIIPLR
jgi:hypothetical protein